MIREGIEIWVRFRHYVLDSHIDLKIVIGNQKLIRNVSLNDFPIFHESTVPRCFEPYL